MSTEELSANQTAANEEKITETAASGDALKDAENTSGSASQQDVNTNKADLVIDEDKEEVSKEESADENIEEGEITDEGKDEKEKDAKKQTDSEAEKENVHKEDQLHRKRAVSEDKAEAEDSTAKKVKTADGDDEASQVASAGGDA